MRRGPDPLFFGLFRLGDFENLATTVKAFSSHVVTPMHLTGDGIGRQRWAA